MSKRASFFLFLGLLLLSLVAGIGSVYWLIRTGWTPFGDPAFTETIPEKRPKRPDRRLLEEFSERSIPEIISELRARRESQGEAPPDPGSSAPPAPPLLSMLPDAPLPFPAGAAPRDPDGLRAFITGIQKDPSAQLGHEDRWRFNLALAALGVKPADIPAEIRLDVNPAPEIDTFPVRLLPRPGEASGAFAIGDFDGEGGPEILAGGGARFYRIAEGAGLESLDLLDGTEPGNGIFPADFDRDGDLDFFLTRGGGLPDSLMRNEGGARFSDVTISLGLLAFADSTAASWLDYDGDGRPDLLVGSLDRPLELYHQTEAGLFQPVAWDLKLWIPRGVTRIDTGDFTGDGHPDFFLGIEGKSGRLYATRPAEIWNEWRFEELPVATDGPGGGETSGAAFFDADNDGRLDLLLTYGPAPRPEVDQPAAAAEGAPGIPAAPDGFARLLRNLDGTRFEDATSASGLDVDGPVSALGLADVDLDGFEEVFLGTPALVPNRVFHNLKGSGFREISVACGGSRLDEPVSFLSADLEANGTSDLVSLDASGRVLWLEATGSSNRWLRVELPGQPAGTRIAVSARDGDWVVQTTERRLGTDPFLTIGLGEAAAIERLEVREASGGEPLKVLEKIEPNQSLLVQLPPQPLKRAVVPLSPPSSGEVKDR